MAPPLPDPSKGFEEQEITVLLGMCLWGEARNQPDDAKLAVGNVIRNRVLAGIYGGNDWKCVILKPKQFSCFNEHDPNRRKMMEPLKHEKPDVWESCYRCSALILSGLAKDNTMRSTHYHDKSLDFRPPFWAKVFNPTVWIGSLRFYRDPAAFKDPADQFPNHSSTPEDWGEA